MLVLVGQVLAKRCVFRCFLKMAKDSAVRIEIGRSFHQLGTVQEKVRESDLVPLWMAPQGVVHLQNATQPTQPCGAHRGCNWADIWGPPGLPNWDPANFVLSFHGGPTWVNPDGLMMGP